ncbi:MAG: GspH/FimT family pseudopilin [Planctomycetota bacterium]
MPGSTRPPMTLCHLHSKRQSTGDSRGPQRGFTVVELLIVVVILSIVALTAIPMMSSAASIQIRSAANMIAADLEYARSMAISRGQNHSVVFDKTADSYRIVDQVGTVIQHPVKKGFTYVVDFRNESRLNRVDITNASFNAAQTVTFDCLGSPIDGGTVNLQAGAITTTITVEPVTGFVSIQ